MLTSQGDSNISSKQLCSASQGCRRGWRLLVCYRCQLFICCFTKLSYKACLVHSKLLLWHNLDLDAIRFCHPPSASHKLQTSQHLPAHYINRWMILSCSPRWKQLRQRSVSWNWNLTATLPQSFLSFSPSPPPPLIYLFWRRDQSWFSKELPTVISSTSSVTTLSMKAWVCLCCAASAEPLDLSALPVASFSSVLQ